MAFNAYMHERNIYRNQPDFTQIALDFPEFRTYAIPDAKGQKVRVDFTNPDALRMLTEILLKKDFNLDVKIPQGFLIPTVPQRLNYILWLEDLLCNVPKRKEYVSGIDIGTGPCAIFSLLGARKNGWKFIATESSNDAILWAEKNINKNNLIENIKVVKVSKDSALGEVLSAGNENYDFCLCNPPFFENIEEIRQKHRNSNKTIADVAQKDEIIASGGELDFVRNILKDSLTFKDRISLFTSMFGKKKSLFEIVKEIQEIKDIKFTTTEFCQGNTVRWGIAWTFNESIHFKEQVKKKKKAKKTKAPLEYQIPLTKSENDTFEAFINQTKSFLKSLQIPITTTRASKNFTELLLKSDKNTWSHQRRKRRELERQKKGANNLEEKHYSTSLSEIDSVPCKGCNSEEKFSLSIKDLSKENDTVDLKNIHTCNKEDIPNKNYSIGIQAVNLESSQMNPSDSLSSKNNDSNDINLLQNNKRKGDFISEGLCINKKVKLEKTPGFSDAFSENVNSDIKDSCIMESTPIKTDTLMDADVTNTKNAVLEKHSVNALPSIPSENNSIDLKSQNIINNKVEDLSQNVIHAQDPSSSSNCEKFYLEGNSAELLSSKKSVDLSSPVENDESSSIPTKTRLNQKSENGVLDSDLILYCHLQFIKGKSKIYVKMNCPVTADRNTMHQVFQLIKNKIN